MPKAYRYYVIIGIITLSLFSSSCYVFRAVCGAKSYKIACVETIRDVCYVRKGEDPCKCNSVKCEGGKIK